jgi:hypothetical protein
VEPDRPTVEEQQGDIGQGAWSQTTGVIEMDPVAQFAPFPFGVVQIVGYRSKAAFGVAAATAVFADKELSAVAGNIDRFTVGPDYIVPFPARRFGI